MCNTLYLVHSRGATFRGFSARVHKAATHYLAKEGPGTLVNLSLRTEENPSILCDLFGAMLAECSAGPETSTQESSRTRVDRGSSRDRTINTDTVSSLPSPSVPICKYIRSKQECPYGPVCRFRHPSQPTSASSPPVCRMFLASRCTYGDRCRYAHPTSDNRRSDTSCDPQLGSLTSFPSLGHDVGSGKKVITTSVVQPVTSSTYQSHQQQSRQRQNKKGHDRGRDVPELNLGAYFERSARITPRPHMSRPVHRQHGSGSKSLLEVECAQLETRFPSPHSEIIHKGKDKTVYSITYTPTDPEWVCVCVCVRVCVCVCACVCVRSQSAYTCTFYCLFVTSGKGGIDNKCDNAVRIPS